MAKFRICETAVSMVSMEGGNMALRMYIIVRDDLPPEHVALTCAHASLAAWFKWAAHEDMEFFPIFLEWKDTSFRKVICKATAEQFERAKLETENAHLVMTESSLGGRETALVLRIAEEYPKFFKFLPKYKYVDIPKQTE